MAFLTVEDMTGAVEVLVFPKTLAECSSFIFEGRIVLISGRVSVREDEDTKVVCMTVEPHKEGLFDKAQPQTKTDSKKKKGLFIRLASREDERRIRVERFLNIFEGTIPVYYYYSDEKKYSEPVMKTEANEPLLKELRRILGNENVAFVE